jgi:hypothetical protein
MLSPTLEHLEQVRVVVRAEDRVSTGALRPDRYDGTRVLLARQRTDRSLAVATEAGGAVGQGECLTVLGGQVGRVAGRQTRAGRVLATSR